MNPLPWLKALPWLIAALMALVAAGAVHLYMGERDELTAFRATVKQANDDQLKVLIELGDQRETNLKETRKEYEDKIPAIRDGAVRAYCLRNPALCQPAARCEDGPSYPVDDGVKQEPVACEREFIRNSAEDAAKVGAWIDYCKRNNCPIED